MQKFTTFIIALFAMLAITTSSNAQRKCNLGVNVTSPANNLSVKSGDTISVAFSFTNYGPDKLLKGDTIEYKYSLLPIVGYAVVSAPMDSGTSETVNPIKIVLVNDSTKDVTLDVCVTLIHQTVNITTKTYTDNVPANDKSCVKVTVKHKVTTNILDFGKNSAQQVVLSPNPTKGDVRFTLNLDKQESVSLSVKDIAGREVMHQNFNNIRAGQEIPFEFNVSGLNNGLYFIEINTDTQKRVGKVFVGK